MLKDQEAYKIKEFMKFKEEGWSNEVAAKKAKIKPAELYDYMKRMPELIQFCRQFMDPKRQKAYDKQRLNKWKKQFATT